MKRILDLFLSFIGLVIFTPLGIVIALLIKCTSKGPIFYKSIRVKDGFQLFKCYKFRTMYSDADNRLKKLTSPSSPYFHEWKTFQKLKKDPRTTSFGKFLRKTSLDELPQLINIIKGDMSLVGPRPYVFFGEKVNFKNELYSLYGKEIEEILKTKPGLTGPWQISGRNTLSLKKRIEIDLCYVKKQSIRSDLMIIIKTIPQIFISKGAF